MCREHYVAQFPMLGELSEQELQERVSVMKLPAGQTFLEQGSSCGELALILSGTARVFKLAESGRELTLYRVGAGESCILTASCLLSETPFPAFAISETDMELLSVPAEAVRRYMHSFESWRDYIFRLLSHRMSLVLSVVEEVAFQRLDVRLAQYLCGHSGEVVCKTHQEVACDLSSSREVVSRLLKEFERKSWVKLSRGKIHLLDRSGLLGCRAPSTFPESV